MPDGVTLKTDPRYSTRATLRGRIEVPDAANNAWVDNIALNAQNGDLGLEIGMQVFGDNFKLTNSDVYGNGSSQSRSCIVIGHNYYGIAYNVSIERNRIHDCGGYDPPRDHGVYLAVVRGGVVRDNLFYNNSAGWDLHLYPDADNVSIANNTLDGSRGGIILAGAGTSSSDSNTLTNNVSSNPTTVYTTGGDAFAVEHHWDQVVGTGNTLTGTCVYSPAGRTFETPISGYTTTGTITADPQYVNRAAKDFRLSAGSPCAGKGVRP